MNRFSECSDDAFWEVRGGFETRPYHNDDFVNMVRHDDKRIQFNACVMMRQIVPRRTNHPAWV